MKNTSKIMKRTTKCNARLRVRSQRVRSQRAGGNGSANNNNAFHYSNTSHAETKFYESLKNTKTINRNNSNPLDCMTFYKLHTTNTKKNTANTQEKQFNCIQGQMSIKIINMFEKLRKQATEYIEKRFEKLFSSNTHNNNTQNNNTQTLTNSKHIAKEIVDMMISDYIQFYTKEITSEKYQKKILEIIKPKNLSNENLQSNSLESLSNENVPLLQSSSLESESLSNETVPLLQSTSSESESNKSKITNLVKAIFTEFNLNIDKYINFVISEGKPDPAIIKILHGISKGIRYGIAAIVSVPLFILPLLTVGSGANSKKTGSYLTYLPIKLWNIITRNNKVTNHEVLNTYPYSPYYEHVFGHFQVPDFNITKQKLEYNLQKPQARKNFLSKLFSRTQKHTNTKAQK